MLLGSVADKVIRGTAMPVLVVNPAAGAFSRVLGAQAESGTRAEGVDSGMVQGSGTRG